MKRILMPVLCFVLVLSMVACGGANQPAEEQGNVQAPVQELVEEDQQEEQSAEEPKKEEQPAVEGKVVDPEDGTELTVDLTKRGKIENSAPAMNSGEFILEGVTLSLPFAASKLMDNGWHFSENSTAGEELMDAQATTNLVSFYLYDDDGNEILPMQVINNADTAKTFAECEVTELKVHASEVGESFGGLILPGGICMNSTAADIIEVFGMPENNPYFDTVFVSDDGIQYIDHKETGFSYIFSFYTAEDSEGELNGNIYSVMIEMEY